MKQFTSLFQKKAAKTFYYVLCCFFYFLLLLSFLTFSPLVLHAAELPNIPIETAPFPTEETYAESEADTPMHTETPEAKPTEYPIPPEAPELPSDNNVTPVLPPLEDAPTPSSMESFITEEFAGTYFVTSSGGLNIRSGPSIQYDIIGNLPYGEEISVTGKVQNDWFEISFQGTNGFISAKYLSAKPPSTLPAETEEIPETLESIIEEPVVEQESVPFVSDTTMLVLLAAITAMILIIIITIISFFHNNQKYS